MDFDGLSHAAVSRAECACLSHSLQGSCALNFLDLSRFRNVSTRKTLRSLTDPLRILGARYDGVLATGGANGMIEANSCLGCGEIHTGQQCFAGAGENIGNASLFRLSANFGWSQQPQHLGDSPVNA